MNEFIPQQELIPISFDPAVDGITQSLIGTWRACQVKARMNIQGYTKGSPELTFYGSIFHTCMEFLLNKIQAGHTIMDEDMVLKSIEYAQEKCKKDFIDSGISGKEEFMQSLALMHPALINYYRVWEEDITSRKKNYFDIEQSFAVKFKDVLLRGKRDGIFEYDYGDRWLLEHKSMSLINEDELMSRIGRDFQNLFYIFSYYLETGIKLKGVLYDIIRKPSIRKKVGESNAVFAGRIGEDMILRPAFYFMRFESAIPWTRVERFSGSLERELAAFVAWWKQDKSLDIENTSSCRMYNSACAFATFCDSEYKNFDALTVKQSHHLETL